MALDANISTLYFTEIGPFLASVSTTHIDLQFVLKV